MEQPVLQGRVEDSLVVLEDVLHVGKLDRRRSDGGQGHGPGELDDGLGRILRFCEHVNNIDFAINKSFLPFSVQSKQLIIGELIGAAIFFAQNGENI
jgi:hypothetical protein